MNDTNVVIYPRTATIIASVCAIIFCVVGILGNSITILALTRYPKLRSHATTAFVLSLCLSDLLFCFVNLPLTASRYIHEKWTFGKTWCTIFPVLFYGNVAVSLLNMVAITLNRYIIISHYHLYNKIYSRLSIGLQIFAVWAIAFLIMLPPLLGIWGELGENNATFSCTIKEKDGKSPKKFIFLIGFGLPCIVIILSYSCIYFRVRNSKKKLKAHRANNSTAPKEKRSRRERDDSRLTKLMLVIFICFLLCFLPLMCVNVFDDDVKYPAIHVFASILAWASSVINPFIYAASNRQYRCAYAKLFNILRTSMSESKQLSNSLKSRTTDQKTGQNVKLAPNTTSV